MAGRRAISVWERFWEKVDKNGPIPQHRPDLGSCWIWTAYKLFGYGRFGRGAKADGIVYAHRFAWELLVGPVPDGLELDHLCRNRACVKAVADEHGPAHLEAVTRRENLLRGETVAAVNAAKTHCRKGHDLLDLANVYHPQEWPTGRICRRCGAEYQAERRRRQREQRAL